MVAFALIAAVSMAPTEIEKEEIAVETTELKKGDADLDTAAGHLHNFGGHGLYGGFISNRAIDFFLECN